MGSCPYFRFDELVRRSQEIRAGREPAQRIVLRTSWCVHPHSPVDERSARSIGGGRRLTCNGDLNRCMVPESQRDDTA